MTLFSTVEGADFFLLLETNVSLWLVAIALYQSEIKLDQGFILENKDKLPINSARDRSASAYEQYEISQSNLYFVKQYFSIN